MNHKSIQDENSFPTLYSLIFAFPTWYQSHRHSNKYFFSQWFFLLLHPLEMATDSVKNNPVITVSTTAPLSAVNLITINAVAQLPLKLTSVNYISWWDQFISFFYGLDLLGYLDWTMLCPPSAIVTNSVSSLNPHVLDVLRSATLTCHLGLTVSDNGPLGVLCLVQPRSLDTRCADVHKEISWSYHLS